MGLTMKNSSNTYGSLSDVSDVVTVVVERVLDGLDVVVVTVWVGIVTPVCGVTVVVDIVVLDGTAIVVTVISVSVGSAIVSTSFVSSLESELHPEPSNAMISTAPGRI